MDILISGYFIIDAIKEFDFISAFESRQEGNEMAIAFNIAIYAIILVGSLVPSKTQEWVPYAYSVDENQGLNERTQLQSQSQIQVNKDSAKQLRSVGPRTTTT